MKLMEVCGTHTMAIARSGIREILPEEIELISGPGCPVCVTPQSEIDRAIEIAKKKDVILATFGDMMRVPGTKESLSDAKRDGADVRIVYSPLDALILARHIRNKSIVFMGIGFETTSPTIAATILKAKKEKVKNFSILSNFKVLFPALAALSESDKIKIDGFICPGHVSVITGISPYKDFVKRYKKPCVITGFEEVDIIRGITRLIDQIKNNKFKVEIEYKRAVKEKGNIKARRMIEKVFDFKDSEWRGLGKIKRSGLKLKTEYKNFDAEKIFKVQLPKPIKRKGCICGEVLTGLKKPVDCKLFKGVCTPQSPVGPCMVSSEGTCAAHYKYN